MPHFIIKSKAYLVFILLEMQDPGSELLADFVPCQERWGTETE
jgi:hypothetical protein